MHIRPRGPYGCTLYANSIRWNSADSLWWVDRAVSPSVWMRDVYKDAKIHRELWNIHLFLQHQLLIFAVLNACVVIDAASESVTSHRCDVRYNWSWSLSRDPFTGLPCCRGLLFKGSVKGSLKAPSGHRWGWRSLLEWRGQRLPSRRPKEPITRASEHGLVVMTIC